MTHVIVMEPGEDVARLLDVPLEDGDPATLQRMLGGYLDAVRLTESHFLYVNEDPAGMPVNEMATKLLRKSDYYTAPSLLMFDRGQSGGLGQQSIRGIAIAFKSDGVGVEQAPDQEFFDLLRDADIALAVELPNGTELRTDHTGNFAFQRAKDGARTINSFALIPDFLLHLRDEKIAKAFDEEAIRQMLNDWLDTGVPNAPGTRVGVRLERLIQVIAQQAATREEAQVLRERLRKLAEEEIEKRQPGDGPVFAKRLAERTEENRLAKEASDQPLWDQTPIDTSKGFRQLTEVPGDVTDARIGPIGPIGRPTTPGLPEDDWRTAVRGTGLPSWKLDQMRDE